MLIKMGMGMSMEFSSRHLVAKPMTGVTGFTRGRHVLRLM